MPEVSQAEPDSTPWRWISLFGEIIEGLYFIVASVRLLRWLIRASYATIFGGSPSS